MRPLLTAPRPLLATALCAASALLLTGCGASEIEPDTTVTARLDQDNLQIILPLDKYLATDEETSVTARAAQEILRTCLQAHGQNGLPPVSDSNGPGAERLYGIWNSERAAVQGFVGSQTTAQDPPAPPGGWSDEADPRFNEVYEQCKASRRDAMKRVSLPETGSIVTDLEGQASQLARQSPAWSAARDDWRECITARGLTARDNDDAWTSQQTIDLLIELGDEVPSDAAKHEEIRVAVIEATCNDETSLTQRLGDLEAGYQAALMKGREADLVAERAENQEFIDAARDYLATHQ